MRNDRSNNPNHVFVRVGATRDYGIVWPSETGAGHKDSEKPNLQTVKDLAELWLQADQDKRRTRKAELEIELAAALACAGRDVSDPIGKIFHHVIRGSAGRPTN